VLKRYTDIVGRTPIPPLWYLGYHQSRFSYTSQRELKQIADDLRTHRIPCDALYLDIHYMDSYKVFTWELDQFSSPRAMLDDLHNQGFKVIAILDPAIKQEPGYEVYESGVEDDVFLTDANGERLTVVVWAGESHLPDFTRRGVRAWWSGQAQKLLESGVDGIWNDMNEPAVFTVDGAATVPDPILHRLDGDETVPHTGAHNFYGHFMAEASFRALQAHDSNKRCVNITRAGFAGTQRYASCWTGDVTSNWEHLQQMIPTVLNMGLSGIPLTGADIGGFRGDTTAELLTRWTQAGALMPFFRNHSAIDTIAQEPWVFGQPYLDYVREAIELRYRLMPYIYTQAAIASEYGYPLVRPVFTTDTRRVESRLIDNCYMLGDAVLVTPVLQEGARQRTLHLPRGLWFDYWTQTQVIGGRSVTVDAPLGHLPLFVKAGAVLPTWDVSQNFSNGSPNQLKLQVFPGKFETVLYEDAGEGIAYQHGDYRWVYMASSWYNNRLRINRRITGAYLPEYETINVRIFGFDEEPLAVDVDGQGAPVWYYEEKVIELDI
ncbi:MAG: TIM-barrel domain-containing protein, partial [Chloroflexota bacterium]